MRIVFGSARLVVGLAIIAAIVGQLITSITFWTTHGLSNYTIQVVNFFSFFTIQSNVAAIVAMVIGAFFLLTRTGADPSWYNTFRSCAATYMIVTGIVYNLLLRNIELPQGATLEWSNEILHLIGPLWLLADWLFAPGRSPLQWKTIGIVVIYPIVWVIYTLIRGPLTFDAVLDRGYWYPYPFLNPNLSQNGYLSVGFYVILIALVIMAAGAGVIWVSRRKMAAVSA